MNIQALKIELVKQILDSDSKELLDEIYRALKGENQDFRHNLTEDQKREIELAREQIARGETEDWQTIKNRLMKKD